MLDKLKSYDDGMQYNDRNGSCLVVFALKQSDPRLLAAFLRKEDPGPIANLTSLQQEFQHNWISYQLKNLQGIEKPDWMIAIHHMVFPPAEYPSLESQKGALVSPMCLWALKHCDGKFTPEISEKMHRALRDHPISDRFDLDDINLSPVHLFAARGDAKGLEILKKNGAINDDRTWPSYTPGKPLYPNSTAVDMAIMHGQPDMVPLLCAIETPEESLSNPHRSRFSSNAGAPSPETPEQRQAAIDELVAKAQFVREYPKDGLARLEAQRQARLMELRALQAAQQPEPQLSPEPIAATHRGGVAPPDISRDRGMYLEALADDRRSAAARTFDNGNANGSLDPSQQRGPVRRTHRER